MRNVCFFVTGLENGGIENYLLRFLKKYHKEYDQIIIVCKGDKFGYLLNEYKKISNVTLIKKKLLFYDLFNYLWLYKFYSSNENFTVCDFTGTFSGVNLLVAYLAGIEKRITFYRESVYQFKFSFLKKIYVRSLEFLVLRFATNILSNSKAAFDNIYGKRILSVWEKCDVIYNGIDIERFLGDREDIRKELNITNNAIIIGHTGRFTSAKNHITIIETALKLCDLDKDFYFLFCGSGVKDNLEKLIPSNLKTRFFLFNDRNDIPKILNTIDVFYFPSINEGQPNALIEAMLMDKKIVTSKIPSIIECTPHDFHKYLIDPTSSDEAIELINGYMNGNVDYSLKKWSIGMFNSDIRFEEFNKKLI